MKIPVPYPAADLLLLRRLQLGGSEASFRLAAQLFGVPPCPVCDFVIQHCKCESKLQHDRDMIVKYYAID